MPHNTDYTTSGASGLAEGPNHGTPLHGMPSGEFAAPTVAQDTASIPIPAMGGVSGVGTNGANEQSPASSLAGPPGSLAEKEAASAASQPPGILQRLMPTGGVLASCFSFSAFSMGAGTLGLPAAMMAAGSAMGSIMLVLVCLSTIYSCRLITIVVEKTNLMTYEQMARGLVGWKFEKLTAFLMVMLCWGATITYVVVVGDVMHKLSVIDWWPEELSGKGGSRIMTVIYWACFMLPLSLAKEINSLRYASSMGVCSTIILVTAIVVHCAQAGPEVAQKNLTYFEFNIDMVVAMPTFLFAYCCQTNAFKIYTEMKPKTVKQMTKNCSYSMVVCTSIYIICGVAGFANFGAATSGNILNNLNPLSSAYVAIAFFAVTITLTPCFPMCMFPTRDAVLQVLGYAGVHETPTKVRVAVCLVLAVGSLILGLFIPGVKVMFGVLGGICGSSLSLIWPAIFYMKGVEFWVQKVGLTNFVLTWLLVIVGVIAGVLGTAVSLYQTITG